MSMVFNNEIGDIIISPNAIAKIAGAVATKCYGVVGMASRNKKDGLVSLLKSDNLTKGVKVTVIGQNVTVDLALMLGYGYNIPTTCSKVQEKVKSTIENMTGLQVSDVNIRIASVDMNQQK